jgi:hypothetical protein
MVIGSSFSSTRACLVLLDMHMLRVMAGGANAQS